MIEYLGYVAVAGIVVCGLAWAYCFKQYVYWSQEEARLRILSLDERVTKLEKNPPCKPPLG